MSTYLGLSRGGRAKYRLNDLGRVGATQWMYIGTCARENEYSWTNVKGKVGNYESVGQPVEESTTWSQVTSRRTRIEMGHDAECVPEVGDRCLKIRAVIKQRQDEYCRILGRIYLVDRWNLVDR